MAKISDISIMLFPWGAENPSVGEIVEAAKLAEKLGFYSVSLPMHMTMPPGWIFRRFPNWDVLDALVVLPAIAAATSTIKLGTNSALLSPALSAANVSSIAWLIASETWIDCLKHQVALY